MIAFLKNELINIKKLKIINLIITLKIFKIFMLNIYCT